ncbi:reducing type I polyketide synthase 10 [Penicillium longicatenatum]|uniref:reducing type I polyketide synthase 10 n=1 Tax=Penicillium longicatenatum TaxID=1561947 RepID=UPI00254766AB|nr:reducing type I polyketide synthase 10 [Penicillium longicatenatum]KAJ5636925.1 reducing type I polyketide synthase 10 [Penicillium longicatenatum]
MTIDKVLVVIDKDNSLLSYALLPDHPDATRLVFKDITTASKDILNGATFILLIKATNSLLATIRDEKMDALKVVTDNTSVLLWVTSGDIMRGSRPDFALVSVDLEYVEKDGVLRVSRFVPDNDLKSECCTKQGSEKLELPLSQARPFQLSLDQPGQFGGIYFQQVAPPPTLAPGDVQVQVKAVGLNAKDLYSLAGKVNTPNTICTLVFSGVIERIGDSVEALHVGDRVIVIASDLHDSLDRRKKQFLVDTFGLSPQNIFTSRDESFAQNILAVTGGKGADVVLNSLTGDLLYATWRCISAFGRFIEIGKRDMVNDGRVDMNSFLHNTTFSAFDLSDIYNHPDKQYHEVCPLSTVRPFFPEKTYLMIGCLGGLGRSMAKWMVARGAQKFVFLGRSGTDRPSARRLIEDLTQSGAHCKVIRGDVCKKADVEAAVAAVNGYIGGVIQAAMGLNVSFLKTIKLLSLTIFPGILFTSMSNNHWHTGIDPNVHGSWDLHHAIKGKDSQLEFFLMTTSFSGSVDTATESNYCAGNFFLDMFARHRHAQGLPAQAIGLGMISEVGYLHDSSEIEALLVCKGIQAINEDELLQIVDVSLSNKQLTAPHPVDYNANAHVLTGLKPFGLMELRKKGFEVTNIAFRDPRAAVLARVLDNEDDGAAQTQSTRGLPADVAKALDEGVPLADAIQTSIASRLGNLVLLPLEKVQVAKPLAQFGMDSMIASKFRTWFFQAFEVDVHFLELMSKTVTVASFTPAVIEAVSSRQ